MKLASRRGAPRQCLRPGLVIPGLLPNQGSSTHEPYKAASIMGEDPSPWMGHQERDARAQLWPSSTLIRSLHFSYCATEVMRGGCELTVR